MILARQSSGGGLRSGPHAFDTIVFMMLRRSITTFKLRRSGSKMGNKSTNYLESVAAAGGSQQTLERQLRHELMQKWRQVYAVALHATTGKWGAA